MCIRDQDIACTTDADGDDRHAGSHGQQAHAWLGFTESALLLPGTFGKHTDDASHLQQLTGAAYGITVVLATTDRENAQLDEDCTKHGHSYEFYLGHPADLSGIRKAEQQPVHVTQVIGGEDRRTPLRPVLRPPDLHAEEEP